MAKKSDAQIGIRVSSGLKERLEAQARRERCTVTGLIIRAVEEYLWAREGAGREP